MDGSEIPLQIVKWRIPGMPQTEEVLAVSNTVQSTLPDAAIQKVDISVVVAAMNEEQNVGVLYTALSAQLKELERTYEIIFIDDGSTDNTFEVLKQLHAENPGVVRVIRFRRNFSKTPALVAGFSRCRGEIIFTMDADLQDDPIEIPREADRVYNIVVGVSAIPILAPLPKSAGHIEEPPGIWLK